MGIPSSDLESEEKGTATFLADVRGLWSSALVSTVRLATSSRIVARENGVLFLSRASEWELVWCHTSSVVVWFVFDATSHVLDFS